MMFIYKKYNEMAVGNDIYIYMSKFCPDIGNKPKTTPDEHFA